MSEHEINMLAKIANKMLDVQQNFMKQVMDALNNLKKLPEFIDKIRQDMNSGFHKVIQSNAEMEIYIRMAQMNSKKTLLNSENEAIEEFKQQLAYDFKEIDNRYTKIQNELNDECKKRIRELDQHLFEIPEQFPMDLYQNFNEEIIPLFQRLLSDTKISYEERLKSISIAVNKSRDAINSFIRIRNEFIRSVEVFQFQDRSKEASTYYVPVWLVETENRKDNKISIRTFFPGDSILTEPKLEEGNLKMISEIALDPLKSVLVESNIQTKLLKSVTWRESPKDKDEIVRSVEKFIDSRYEGRYSGVKKAVLKSLEDGNLKFIKQN